MPDPNFPYVNATDGESIETTDFNNVQIYTRAQMLDQVRGARLKTSFYVHGPYARDYWIYAESSDDGLVHIGDTSSSWSMDAGVIYQWVGGFGVYPNGTTWNLLPYELSTTEIKDIATIANANVNPRVDCIFVKLDIVDGSLATRDFKDAATGALSTQSMVTTRKVRLQYQVVQGTPTAFTATNYPPNAAFPATPAGWVRIASLVIDGSASTIAQVIDHRMPIGFNSQLAFTAMVTGWTGQTNGAWKSTGGAGSTIFLPFTTPWNGRLLSVAFPVSLASGATVQIISRTMPASAAANVDTVLADITSSLTSGSFLNEVRLDSLTSGENYTQPIWLGGASTTDGFINATGPNRIAHAATLVPLVGLLVTANSATDYIQGAQYEVAGYG